MWGLKRSRTHSQSLLTLRFLKQVGPAVRSSWMPLDCRTSIVQATPKDESEIYRIFVVYSGHIDDLCGGIIRPLKSLRGPRRPLRNLPLGGSRPSNDSYGLCKALTIIRVIVRTSYMPRGSQLKNKTRTHMHEAAT